MARSLLQSQIAKALQTADRGVSEDDGLPAGHMRLYSYYKPALQAGLYGIEAKQTISAIAGNDTTAQTLTVFNPGPDSKILRQEFRVIAPQFSLDPKLVNTYYPPAGHQDEGRILPHIVFNDPHVPWLREAGRKDWMVEPIDTAGPDDTVGHNFVPWIGLMVFRPDADELKVDPTTATKLGLDSIVSKDGTRAYNASKLPESGAYPMAVGDYLSKITSRVYYEDGYTDPQGLQDFAKLKSSTEPMSAIFPTKLQLKDVILGSKEDLAPLKAQKLLAHVRHINTIGFPDAGVGEDGFYSVVVSSMTGDQKELAPTTHVVHLVSLEHLDATLTDPSSSYFGDGTDRIGLVSLFSWTYTCTPDGIDFYDAMETIGKQAQPLRPPKEILKVLKDAANAGPSATDPNSAVIAQVLYDRLMDGYTIARWRSPAGEESVAFNRGPLVPIQTQDIPTPPPATSGSTTARPWPVLSMTGKDYAVLDSSVGMMDVTYSAAWSLGKLMAISNSVFNGALMRFRSTVWQVASSVTRMQANQMLPAASLLVNSNAAITAAASVTAHDFSGPVSRVNVPAQVKAATSMDDPTLQPAFRQAIVAAMNSMASSGTGDSSTLCNGFDDAPGNNSDWEILLNWIHDALYLSNIPAHVLFPEPSHLQSHNTSPVPPGQPRYHPEALRFFYIDNAWIDAYVDGALSCANHLEPEYDYTRLCIKSIFNDFLKTPIGKTGILPPVPRYGFILNSAVVKANPDLRLTVTCWMLGKDKDGNTAWLQDTNRNPLVRHTKMDDFTILSLVDCMPEEICTIEFAQPPHQQRFSMNCKPTYDNSTGLITSVVSDVKLRRLYTDATQAPPVWDVYDTDPPPADPKDLLEWRPFPDSWKTRPEDTTVVDQSTWYNDATRCIDAAQITATMNQKLNFWAQGSRFNGTPPYDDPVPSSCVFGLEMNDSSVRLTISNPHPDNPTPFPSWTRKLYLGPADAPSPTAASTMTKAVTTSTPTHLQIQTNSPTSATIPRQSITIIPHNPEAARPVAPPRTLLNTSKAIPLRHALAAAVSPGILDPFTNSLTPQFELLVHPDYRPPPPRPFHSATTTSGRSFNNDVYSPLDYLATGTDTLYDVVFAIRRRNRLATPYKLQSLTIEMPVSDGQGDEPDKTGHIREPLLEAGDYSGTGVRMCSNQRFVPTLFQGVASTIGSDLWDGKPVLGIRLVPRSGTTTGTLALGNDLLAAEASVRLGEPLVKAVVDENSTVLVAQVDPATHKPFNAQMNRGRCMVRLSEQYGDNRVDQWSWCVALKVDGGDADPWGNKI